MKDQKKVEICVEALDKREFSHLLGWIIFFREDVS